MPEISRFFGIVIKMFWGDHNPPHFHAFYRDPHRDLVCQAVDREIRVALDAVARLASASRSAPDRGSAP
jgi:hypothetical protein